MAKYDRTKLKDAQRAVERLIPDPQRRQKFIHVLCDAIAVADAIDPANWNLNLDPSGAFLRFNTGHEYCIQLDRNTLLLLCNRSALRHEEGLDGLPVAYKGWNGAKNVYHRHYDHVPDALRKTKDSVGCCIDLTDDYVQYIDRFRKANHVFIHAAMRTRLLMGSRKAHSPGAVEYIFTNFQDVEE